MSNLLAKRVKEEAHRKGFDVCQIAQIDRSPHYEDFTRWLSEGQHGQMEWLERKPELREDPRHLLAECQSVIMTGVNYFQKSQEQRGKIAVYALGLDYHELISERLHALCHWLSSELGGTHRPFVDTSAVMEKPWAMQAGLGWQGKNTLLIHKKMGTWLTLGGILSSLKLEADTPEKDHCGTCHRCLDVCPTQAITAPYQLDARRCIAYLTIEHQGSIPLEFRRAIGDRVFGCDDCLSVCPWNRWAQETKENHFAPIPRPDLAEMLSWDDPTFRKKYRGTPIFRLKRPRWIRNLCVVLGNIGTRDDLAALEKVKNDPDPLIQEHAQWALAEINQRLPN